MAAYRRSTHASFQAASATCSLVLEVTGGTLWARAHFTRTATRCEHLPAMFPSLSKHLDQGREAIKPREVTLKNSLICPQQEYFPLVFLFFLFLNYAKDSLARIAQIFSDKEGKEKTHLKPVTSFKVSTVSSTDSGTSVGHNCR